MAAPPREVHLKVDLRYALIKVVPKPEEAGDANFPRNLHNAAELLLRAHMVAAAEALRASTAQMLELLAAGPDGKTGVRLGRATVCWGCGHAGLPTAGTLGDAASKARDVEAAGRPPPCAGCGEDDQTNWVRVTEQGKAGEVPWLEAALLSADEAAAEARAATAARRAEVETSVAAALHAREARGGGAAAS
jgi:hypothetical protein